MTPEIKSAIHEVMLAAIEVNESGAAHVFVRYSGHINQIHVDADLCRERFGAEAGHDCLMDRKVYVSGNLAPDDLLEQLQSIRDEINTLRRQNAPQQTKDDGAEWAFEMMNKGVGAGF